MQCRSVGDTLSQASKAQSPRYPQSLPDNAAIQFRLPLTALAEGDRVFGHARSKPKKTTLQLNLKRIAIRSYRIYINGAKKFFPKTVEPGGKVMNRYAQDGSRINVCGTTE